MFPYQPHQLTTNAGSISDLKYPNFDLASTNDLSSKTVRAFENLALPMPVSFLAPFSAPSLIKPANGTGLSQTNPGNAGGQNIPVKGLYIIDQNKNIRKLTLPANPTVSSTTATSAFTATSSPSSSSISPPSSASSSSSSSVSTTPLMPCITTAQHSASACGVDPPSATYLLSSLIGQSSSSSITPTKHGIASGASLTNGLVSDIYPGNMLVRKRRKQDLSSPVLSNHGTNLFTASITNGTSSLAASSNGMSSCKTTYPFPGAMADLTNTNGPISLLSTSLLHHPVSSYNGLVKPILRPLSPLPQPHSTSTTMNMCSSTSNGDSYTNGHLLEPISPCAADSRYMPTSSTADFHSSFSSYNQIEKGDYQQNYQHSASMTQLNPLLMENDISAQLDEETVQNLSKEFRYVGNNGLSWSAKKCKTHVAIAKSYKPTWKSRSHHYQKYSDIKATKDAGVKSTSSISARELDESLNEWKLHYVIGQVNSLMSYENESMNLINDVELLIEAMKKYAVVNRDLFARLNDSIRANSQRHRYVNEQLEEAHLLIHKLFEHKDKFKNVLIESVAQNNTVSSRGHLEENGGDENESCAVLPGNGLYGAETNETDENNNNNTNANGPKSNGKLTSSVRAAKSLKKSMNTRNTIAKSKKLS